VKLRAVVPVALAVGALAWVGANGLRSSLAYYLTPTEVVHAGATGQRIRMGGYVEPGSVHRDGIEVSFVMTDGTTQVPVREHGDTPALFRGGSGAVVEGTYDAAGRFDADTVLVKHSEVYEPPGSLSPPPAVAAGAP